MAALAEPRGWRVESPEAFLLTTVTRLYLDDLGSAHARPDESRSDRLPEAVALDEGGIGRMRLLVVSASVTKDTSAMEHVVRGSAVDWTISRPPSLNDDPLTEGYRVADELAPRGRRSSTT